MAIPQTAQRVSKLAPDRRRLVAQRLRRVQGQMALRLEARLVSYFGALGRRVAQRFREAEGKGGGLVGSVQKQQIALIYRIEDAALLERILLAFEAELAEMVADVVEPLVQPEMGAREELRRIVRARGAQRVVNISGTIRMLIQDTIANGIAVGASNAEIGRALEAAVANPARAQTIARTETATAAQDAAHDRYGRAGVTHVDITDGPGCGWTSHTDPDKADGSRRTLQAAEAQPLSHPNCRRASLPVLD